ncbi:XdhC family protein [Sphingopyxis sp.]|uniref:XdhC family protein n=1 Tax=Sphingopyxis sp. TaxID=1908224 RepID=UPI0025ED1BF6|nr:XdhC family protein [Sphingopyxis sp.]
MRFGAGSPYFDIRLPCGGGIDLLFTPNPNSAAIAEAISRLNRREPVSLEIAADGVRVGEASRPTGWRGDTFVMTYTPRLRLVLFGQGEELTATAQLAHAFGAQTEAYSPSARDIRTLRAKSIEATLLEFRAAQPRLATDPWSAIIFVFHDRDWEEALIPWALALPKFYLGALGSRFSHKKRCEMLVASGVPDVAIQAIRSPIGLVPSTRDPSTLAASILADIVQAFTIDAALPLVRFEEGPDQLLGRF